MNEAAPNKTDEPVVRIIDDDPSVRAALVDLLASVDLVARGYGSTNEFIETDARDAPGCVLLDIRMPGQSGFDFQ